MNRRHFDLCDSVGGNLQIGDQVGSNLLLHERKVNDIRERWQDQQVLSLDAESP